MKEGLLLLIIKNYHKAALMKSWRTYRRWIEWMINTVGINYRMTEIQMYNLIN